jgi:hypothetical protein
MLEKKEIGGKWGYAEWKEKNKNEECRMRNRKKRGYGGN